MNEKKIPYIVFMQVVSAFAVIMLHTNRCFWEFSTDKYWISANVIESVFYFAVPIFYMITGITLINYPERYSTTCFFMKRIKKVVIPFVAWSLIGYVYRIATGTMSYPQSIVEVINKIMKTEIVGIYNFIPSLLCVYLCIPLFAAIDKEKRKKTFSYLLVAGIIFNVIIPFVQETLLPAFDFAPLSVQAIGGNLVLVIGGIFLHENPLNKKNRYILYTIGLLALMLHMVGTYVQSVEQNVVIRTYKGYTNLPCVLYSFAIFVLLQQVGKKIMDTKICTIIFSLGKYTFPVYLIHWFILDMATRFLKVNIYSLKYRLGAPLLIYTFIMLITYIFRKIPIVRRIIP